MASYLHARLTASVALAAGALPLGAPLFGVACTEQYADVVVVDPNVPDGADGSSDEFGDGDSGSGVDLHDQGLDELCLPCTSSAQCGSDNDFCLQLSWLDGFCGMDCDRDSDCPRGYECTNLSFSPDLEQCTPSSGYCDPEVPDSSDVPDNSDLAIYLFDLINEMREAENLDPLAYSSCLDGIAGDALADLERTGIEGYKFRGECEDDIPECECNWQADSQDRVSPVGLTWQEAIQRPLETARDPGSNFHEVFDEDWGRAGVAVDFDHDYLYISVEFGP